ncbi:MAG: GPR1/FUN34/YaaH family transporter [Eggerthella lenta]
MGHFPRGCAQLIAGLIDLRKNNAFGGTAFIAYGCFGLPWHSAGRRPTACSALMRPKRSIRAKQEPLSWRTSS